MPDSPESGSVPGGAGRRSFTDVASLFQPIVPPAGTPPRPEPAPRRPPLQAAGPPPPAPPIAAPAAPPPSPAAAAPTPAAAPAGAGDESWAAAWEPKPNWQPRRSWTWLLLVPFVAVGAWMVLSVDPEAIRTYVAAHVWSRQAAAPALPAPRGPPQPGPPQPGPPQPGPPQQASAPPAPAPSPAPSPPPVPTTGPLLGPVVPEASPAPPAAEPASTPLGPLVPDASPRAAPPSDPAAPIEDAATAGPPAAAAPAPAAAPARPAFGQVVIRYRRSRPTAEPDAARLAARLQDEAERVETRPAAVGYTVPTVLYFRADDRAVATALAQQLAEGGVGWNVRAGQARQRPGYLELWVP